MCGKMENTSLMTRRRRRTYKSVKLSTPQHNTIYYTFSNISLTYCSFINTASHKLLSNKVFHLLPDAKYVSVLNLLVRRVDGKVRIMDYYREASYHPCCSTFIHMISIHDNTSTASTQITYV